MSLLARTICAAGGFRARMPGGVVRYSRHRQAVRGRGGSGQSSRSASIARCQGLVDDPDERARRVAKGKLIAQRNSMQVTSRRSRRCSTNSNPSAGAGHDSIRVQVSQPHARHDHQHRLRSVPADAVQSRQVFLDRLFGRKIVVAECVVCGADGFAQRDAVCRIGFLLRKFQGAGP